MNTRVDVKAEYEKLYVEEFGFLWGTEYCYAEYVYEPKSLYFLFEKTFNDKYISF